MPSLGALRTRPLLAKGQLLHKLHCTPETAAGERGGSFDFSVLLYMRGGDELRTI